MREKAIKVVDTQAETCDGDDDARNEKMDKNTITCVSKNCAY